MKLLKWPKLATRSALVSRIFRVRVDRCQSPRTGAENDFYVLECGDWVNVIALTEAGEVLFVRQYRFGVEDFTVEIPGGMIDPGEEPLEAARRELREETGYEAGELRHLGKIHPNPALQNNATHTFLATGCRKVDLPKQDTLEDIEVFTAPMAEVDRMLARGDISHALVAVAFLHLKLDGAK